MTAPPVVYVDTSALGALLIDQPESQALLDWLDRTPATLVSSDLLETELRRVAIREGLEQPDVSRILEGVALAALDRAVYRGAGFLPMPYLRTLDALHLEAAIRLDVAAVLTYDRRLGEAARATGLEVIAPGTDGAQRSGGRRQLAVDPLPDA
ncbi:type II toxin-antitoxin system VapC family toxin [Microlunatus speluncae]|uniref:type II toxin-antitoxin system VapC family toxin n=1 Tax=Microlunatus speluncae TaxID=2594267 RepID=UPI0012663913|nr:type II toxin-antitoxin system VapC family toxin [Microlunatus speluncae]